MFSAYSHYAAEDTEAQRRPSGITKETKVFVLESSFSLLPPAPALGSAWVEGEKQRNDGVGLEGERNCSRAKAPHLLRTAAIRVP